jgi:hypothetical protein
MATITFKGMTTKRLYRFGSTLGTGLPVALQGASGQPIRTPVTFNGETVIYVNNDGSIQRGTAGPVPVGNPDVYSTYAVTSAWEQQ